MTSDSLRHCLPSPSLGVWHLGTVPRASRSKGAPRYGGDSCSRRWIDDQSSQFSSF